MVTGASRDERTWSVAVSTDTEGTSYHLVDGETGKRTLLHEADIYGGYAVLQALTATPRAFAAGVAASAPADWVAALEQMPPYGREGARDIRGMTGQARAVVAALRAREARVECLELPDEGHWIQNWQSNVRLYRSLESFLGAQLGGRRSPLDAIELWLGLQ